MYVFSTFSQGCPCGVGAGANLQLNGHKTWVGKLGEEEGNWQISNPDPQPLNLQGFYFWFLQSQVSPPQSVSIYDTWMCKHFVWCKNRKGDLEIKERAWAERSRVLVCLNTGPVSCFSSDLLKNHAQHLHFQLIRYCLFGGPSFVICLEAVIFISVSGWSSRLPIRWRVLSVVWLGSASRWPFYSCVMRACSPGSL